MTTSPGKDEDVKDFLQNRFSAFTQNIADGYKDEEERLPDCVVKDMEIWESSGQWIVSSYSPMKEKLNVSGFSDFLPELHLECYECRANSNIRNYINSVPHNGQWKNQLPQLKALNALTKAAVPSELNNTITQPLPSFGFGGPQTSSLGLPSFPVNSSSNSATSFSFTMISSLASASSSGNTAAFESISTASVSGHNITSTSSALTNKNPSKKLFTPKAAEELKQSEAKKIAVRKIRLKLPLLEL
ncbi:LOW QUALITY PROTEIN: nucleoporin NUP42-like [Cyanocitta cristata]